MRGADVKRMSVLAMGLAVLCISAFGFLRVPADISPTASTMTPGSADADKSFLDPLASDSIKTVTASSFTAKSGAEVKTPLATITTVAGKVTGSPNALGLFARVPIALEETVQVAVSYPGGAAGDLVTVQAEDGGSINGGSPVAQMRLDEAGALRFAFTSTREGGIYRKRLR